MRMQCRKADKKYLNVVGALRDAQCPRPHYCAELAHIPAGAGIGRVANRG